MAIPIVPRPLNKAERAVLERILSEEFEGHGELLDQLDHTQVVAVWSEGSVSVDLQVPGVSRKSSLSGLVPVRAVVESEPGEPIGEFLVWVRQGILSGLEYAWYLEEMPTVLPSADKIYIA